VSGPLREVADASAWGAEMARPGELLESELFGCRRGALTGACARLPLAAAS